MSKKEEHSAKKMVQSLDLDKPSVDFTDKIMSKVSAIADDAAIKDAKLTVLLKNNALESPVANFSSKVMTKINAGLLTTYKPLIGKKSWIIIALLFSAFISYSLFSKSTTSTESGYLSKFLSILDDLSSNLGSSLAERTEIPSILVASVLCLSTLLILDFLFRTKKISIN